MKGQITIPIMTAIAIGQIVVGGFASYYSSQISAQDKINDVQREFTTLQSNLSNRVVVVETIVPIMQKDTAEIKESLKNIERAFRIAPTSVKGGSTYSTLEQ